MVIVGTYRASLLLQEVQFRIPTVAGSDCFSSLQDRLVSCWDEVSEEEATSLSSEVEARDKQAFAENLLCVKFIKAAKVKTQITGRDFMLKQVLNDVLKSPKILSLYIFLASVLLKGSCITTKGVFNI